MGRRLKKVGKSTLNKALHIAFEEGYYAGNAKSRACRGMMIMTDIERDSFNEKLDIIIKRINKELK